MTHEMMNLRSLVEKPPRRRCFARYDRLRRPAVDGNRGRIRT